MSQESAVQQEQAARDFIVSMAGKDYDRMRGLLSEDVNWWLPPSVERLGSKSLIEGRDEFMESMERFQTPFESIEMLQELVTAGGGDGVGMIVRTNGVLEGGKPYTDHLYGFFFRFAEDGSITDVWEMADTRGVAEARGFED